MIGDECGGFVVVDKDTAFKLELHWARILVRIEGELRSNLFHILVGARSYFLQIWWELQPRVSRVFPGKFLQKDEGFHLKEEENGKSLSVASEWYSGRANHDDGQRDDGSMERSTGEASSLRSILVVASVLEIRMGSASIKERGSLNGVEK